MKYLNNFNSLNENLREKSPVWKVVDENFVYIRDLGYEVSPKLSGLDFCIVYITKNIGNPLDDLIDLGEELKSLEKLLGVKYEIKFGFSISSRSIGADIKFTEKKKGENKISIDDLIESKLDADDSTQKQFDINCFIKDDMGSVHEDSGVVIIPNILNDTKKLTTINYHLVNDTFGNRLLNYYNEICTDIFVIKPLKYSKVVKSVKNKDLLLDLVSRILIYILGSRKVELVSKEIIGNDFKFKFKLKG